MAQPADRTVHALLQSLHQNGVRHFVVAPGSRNTPIIIAATAPGSPFKVWLHLDERSAGYFALGIARQTGEPVGITCTSGTAVANLLPAAVEARLSRVPLILITADRPPEARDIGASQTVDQVGIFSSHVKWSVDMPAADASAIAELERYAAMVGARAAAAACEAPAGPVHLNVPLREPLLDAESEMLPFDLGTPEVHRAIAAPARPTPGALAIVVQAVAGKRGLIVCGPESSGLPASAITSLAAVLGWPIIADPLSGMRAGRHPLAAIIDRADVLAREPAFTTPATPEVTIRFGAAPTSKPLNIWLATLNEATQIVVDPAVGSGGGWRDPDLRSAMAVAADPGAFCSALLESLDARSSARPEWLALWCDANAAARSALDAAIAAIDEPFEGQAVLDIAGALSDGATLVAGNSMPVRDIDSFFPNIDRAVRIVGTRGASGIDGVTSSAVGAAAVGGPVALMIGDLSFLHDINGLWPLRRHDLSLTVVLVNNDGGGIFSFLPQRTSMPERFEAWWGTPHGLDLRHAVALHGGRHALLERGSASAAIGDALQRPGLDVLELRTDRDRNVALHEQVWAAATAAVRHAVVAARA
ncbi:MAG: 2-succinyl-5-enolpyruvyl-6-hydroxy-3-cyclohexene-1-carboxylic-acid synthase [Chloroflexi bacterium]|nr:MAG: 2-succinyl-5-enolpyruvyl-6-hydroxy-3-cyclohexene-1-carboxylic-acid synthase [Chloroflexota bacterium]